MLMFSYHYTPVQQHWDYTGVVTLWANEACGTAKNTDGARVSHGERENRENLERDNIPSNFYMFSWRYKTLHLI